MDDYFFSEKIEINLFRKEVSNMVRMLDLVPYRGSIIGRDLWGRDIFDRFERLFEDLECELTALTISMEIFLKILDDIAKSGIVVNRDVGLEEIIAILRVGVQKLLDMRCER